MGRRLQSTSRTLVTPLSHIGAMKDERNYNKKCLTLTLPEKRNESMLHHMGAGTLVPRFHTKGRDAMK